MKTAIFIFLFIPGALLPPQRIFNQALDLNRNLGEIHLGDNYEKWKNYLFDKVVYDNHLSSYTLKTDSCCNTLFENPASLISVTFQDNKIVLIRMELKNFLEGKKMTTSAELKVATESAANKYAMINKQFSALLGNPNFSRSNAYDIPNEATSVAQWKGTDTFLETQYHFYKAIYPPTRTVGPPAGLTQKLVEANDKTVIILSDLNFIKGRISSEF